MTCEEFVTCFPSDDITFPIDRGRIPIDLLEVSLMMLMDHPDVRPTECAECKQLYARLIL